MLRLNGERTGLYYGADFTITGGTGSVMIDPKGDGYSDLHYDTSSIAVINYGVNGAIVTGLPPMFPGDEAATTLNVLNIEIKANDTDSIKINGVVLPNIVAQSFTIPL